MVNTAFYPALLRNQELFLRHGELLPRANAIAYLMMGTGVYRLYTKEDFEEFLKRLFLLYKRMNIAENFFCADYLLSFSTGEEIVTIQVTELQDYIGLSFSKNAIKNVDFAEWLGKIQQSISNCILVSILKGYTLFQEYYQKTVNPVVQGDHVSFEANYKIDTTPVEITEEDIVRAGQLAKIISQEIPEGEFKQWDELFPEAIIEYNEEANKVEEPELVYDYESLSDEAKQLIKEHFEQFFPGEEYEKNKDKINALTYLAWLYANNLMVWEDLGDGYWMEPWHPYAFDDSCLRFNGGWICYEQEREYYVLDDIYDVLHVPEAGETKEINS